MAVVRSAIHSSARALGTSPYDVVIVGGGMVGMALAASLSTDHMGQYLKMAVLDSAPVRDELSAGLPDVPSSRVSTVTPRSIALFKESGAWQHMQPPNSCTFRHMQVWDEAGSGCLRWDSAEVGLDVMGAVVENGVIQAACMRAAAEASSRTSAIDFVWPAVVKAMVLPPYKFSPSVNASDTAAAGVGASASEGAAGALAAPPPGSLAELHLEDGTVMKARLIVAADGARSRLREWAQLRTFGLQYGQSGLVATVACEENRTAWQRFLKRGPLALLPARGGYSNIVWTTTPEEAERLKRLKPSAFAAEVNAALQSGPAPPNAGIARLFQRAESNASWLPPPTVHGWAGSAPASFPLQLRHAGRYVRPRFALVGDAAHAVHPLAGQGVNLGFGDVERLSRALSEAVRSGRDVGDVAMLQDEYERERMAANTTMMAGLHAIQRCFGAQSTAVAAMRNVGMGFINSVGPVKNNLMRVAMGDFK